MMRENKILQKWRTFYSRDVILFAFVSYQLLNISAWKKVEEIDSAVRSQNSSVEISDCTMGWMTEERGFHSRQGPRFFSSPQRPGRLWNLHSVLCNGYWGPFFQDLSGQGVNLTVYCPLVSRLGECRAPFPHTLYIAWCLIKQNDRVINSTSGYNCLHSLCCHVMAETLQWCGLSLMEYSCDIMTKHILHCLNDSLTIFLSIKRREDGTDIMIVEALRDAGDLFT
jgi:hypothetical protein